MSADKPSIKLAIDSATVNKLLKDKIPKDLLNDRELPGKEGKTKLAFLKIEYKTSNISLSGIDYDKE